MSFILDHFADVPHVSDYFGIWAVHEQPFRQMVERFNQIADLQAHVADPQNASRASSANRRGDVEVDENGIAMFFIGGPMSKSVGSMQAGTSTIRVRQQLRSARRDPAVKGAILVMDTPGGTVKGNKDLADEVAAFDAEKPLYVFGEDLIASAGVSVASQARKVWMNQGSALYGSMGTYSVIYDQSKAADKLGITAHVIRAGQFKGMGTPGAPVTDEELAELQRTVDELNETYVQLIASGRGMGADQVRSMADGRIHSANDAMGMGLIDAVGDFDKCYAALLADIGGSATSSRHTQDTTPAPPARQATAPERTEPEQTNTTLNQESETMAAASLKELKATFPNASSDWILAQIEAEADLQTAAIAYAQHVEEKATAAREEHEKQLEEAQKASKAKKSLGHAPLTTQSVEGSEEYQDFGDPVADFNAAVTRQMQANGTRPGDAEGRFRAIAAVAKRNEGLYQAYLLATNTGAKQTRQLKEKFEEVAG